MDELERQELQERIEAGRRAQIARDVLDEHMRQQKELIVSRLESGELSNDGELTTLVMYLRVMKIFENTLKSKMDTGELAEKEVSENGE